MRKLDSAIALAFLLLWPLRPPPDVMTVDLRPETVQGFNRYVEATESRIAKELTRPGAFLYIEGLPDPERSKTLASIRGGKIYIEPLETRDDSGAVIQVPGGLVHHWLGAVFIPRATLGDVLKLVQNYDRHQDIYKPEVVRSRLVRHEGNEYQIFYRLREKKIITVTLDTDHDVKYFPMDATHCHSHSASTRIAEVVHAGQPDEHEKPVGHDGGFLWRLNSDWRFEENGGGVYVEVESVSLTRSIPSGLGWLVRPFVTSIPRESLLMTLGATRSAVEAKLP